MVALARPLAVLMGAEGEVADGATTYLRIAALAAPAFMLASAGQGYLRGIGDLTTPLKILVAAHVANVVLELLFVYGFGWGLAGSAWGTVIAQLGMGAAFLVVQHRAGWERPHPARMRTLMRVGRHIAVRTTALLGAFLVASAVLARIGSAALGAHAVPDVGHGRGVGGLHPDRAARARPGVGDPRRVVWARGVDRRAARDLRPALRLEPVGVDRGPTMSRPCVASACF